MFGKSLILLSAPLSGARPLAEALFNAGWHTGGFCLPDRRDPSRSSFENEQLVLANKTLLATPLLAKPDPSWNEIGRNNWAIVHNRDLVGNVPRVWSDRVMLPFSTPGIVVKDAQLAFTIHKWLPIFHPPVLSSPPTFEVVVLFRFPMDFVAAALEGCDKHWPEIPKDPDYFLALWLAYYNAITLADNGSFHYFHATDQLTDEKGVSRLRELVRVEVKPLLPNKVTHRSHRDKASMPAETWALYDALYWLTMGQRRKIDELANSRGRTAGVDSGVSRVGA